jgi:hypothetical protein
MQMTSGKDKTSICCGVETSTDITCSRIETKTPTCSLPMQSEKLTAS